jgi:hypothetical protein
VSLLFAPSDQVTRAGLLVELTRFVDEETEVAMLAAPVRAAADGVKELEAFIRLQSAHNPLIAAVSRAVDEGRRHDDELAAAWQGPIDERLAASERIVRRLRAEGRLSNGWTIPDARDYLCTLTGIRTWEDLVVDRGWSATRYTKVLVLAARRALVTS